MTKKVIAFALALLMVLSAGLALAQEEAWNDKANLYLPGEIKTTDEEKAATLPVFLITMEDGRVMRGVLYPEIAPNTVGNFIALANSGFYDGSNFHRVIPGFMIQGGSGQGTGTKNPGWTILGEFAVNGVANALSHEPGVLSMARLGSSYNSAGSQFFIVTGNALHLDGSYAAFGRLTEGLDIAEAIADVPRNESDWPLEEQAIHSIRVETFGIAYLFAKMQ